MEHAIIQTQHTAVDYPNMNIGFQCFVCETRFASSEERIQHLETGSHSSMYDTDTASPQEREDTRQLQ
jgi:hypothetical protein